MRALLRLAILFACSLSAAAVQAATAQPEHPLLGVWEFTLPDGRCTETYLFKANGTTFVTSAEEVAEMRYEVSAEPSEKGFYKLVDTVTQDNGRKDCGGGITAVGSRSTHYLWFHPSGELFVMCRDESLDACFGPLLRVPRQEV
jgi:hypothetical protein